MRSGDSGGENDQKPEDRSFLRLQSSGQDHSLEFCRKEKHTVEMLNIAVNMNLPKSQKQVNYNFILYENDAASSEK